MSQVLVEYLQSDGRFRHRRARIETKWPNFSLNHHDKQAHDLIDMPIFPVEKKPGVCRSWEARRIRSWTMLSPSGHAQALEVIRDGEPIEVSLVPDPYPMKWPELPGPPPLGSKAPELKLSAYRGTVPIQLSGGPHLLFFWATWCGPCKAAIPELLEFERTGAASVLAITDERTEPLDRFFAMAAEFPANVAIDEYRQAFRAYGVSGTPTFVVIDRDGKITSQSSGYSREKGLAHVGAALTGKPVVDSSLQ